MTGDFAGGTLRILAQNRAFTLWHFQCPTRPLADVWAPGFFDGPMVNGRPGSPTAPPGKIVLSDDLVLVSAADGVASMTVTGRRPGLTVVPITIMLAEPKPEPAKEQPMSPMTEAVLRVLSKCRKEGRFSLHVVSSAEWWDACVTEGLHLTSRGFELCVQDVIGRGRVAHAHSTLGDAYYPVSPSLREHAPEPKSYSATRAEGRHPSHADWAA